MSTKIKLFHRKELDLELIEEGIELYIHRIIANVRILSLSEPLIENAILDTGSPITIIPKYIWNGQDINFIKHNNKSIFGFGKNKLNGNLAKIEIVFLDDVNISTPMEIMAYLIFDNSIPFIIGMADIVDNIQIKLDGKKKQFNIQI